MTFLIGIRLTVDRYILLQVQPNNSTLPQQNVNPNIQIPDQYNTPQCIGFQDNTIRFDLQKIAADYQVICLTFDVFFFGF